MIGCCGAVVPIGISSGWLKLAIRLLNNVVVPSPRADLACFRQATEVSLIRKSTLSRQLQQLEHSLGIRLFRRSSNTSSDGRRFSCRVFFGAVVADLACKFR
ncbi:LysR family transcriptional regulator [Bradyrhizobium sp. USDA 4449]